MNTRESIRQRIKNLAIGIILIMLSVMFFGWLTNKKAKEHAHQTQMEILEEIRNDIKELKQCLKENESQ
jgi:CHASE3 domain sensor protein